ncbi:hypothetical protein Ait01nite_065960 [Actinoplanes italicus]|uniref:Uncharacterized protein DUF3152 n=1 Tax=Actinoplanes italicus TaxID=113567 RepID=A0A2T0KQF0_9ACTN|nr:DUF3152 domain-containing protein [Actinoplanes italicus]PRX25967.1 uncharacterized protein DUF3152 [Actinoplanes italicus]GIE33551.1 hypothetical protein Ait01nite_065960 [Actinoplanes italicus]
MNPSPHPPAEPRSLSSGDRWRQAWLVVLAATVVLFTVVAVGRPFEPQAGPPGNAAAAASPSSAPVPSPVATTALAAPATASPSPTPTSPFPAEGVLRLDGNFPVKGSGGFDFANERGPVAGSRGTIRRFKVAVEKGSGEDVAAFAAQVRAILSDERSWIGGGNVRMQMVAAADRADFTVYLATRETAGRMCEMGGTSIRINGVPFTSCRAVGKAIINLDRWRGSARPYLEAGVGLAAYRQYVINHEVGHELGHRHEGCPKAGGPAPVMVQQTLTLRGCVPFSWPRHNGRDLSGPRL